MDFNNEDGICGITRKIHDYANKVKVEPEVRDVYMTFEDKIYYERKDAAKEATEAATLSTTIQCICDLLEDYGPIPNDLVNRLNNEKDICTLTKWHKLAAKADSIEEFIKVINEQNS